MDKKFIKDEFEKMKIPQVDVREDVLNSIHGEKVNRRKKFRPKAMLAVGLTLIMLTGVVFATGKLINVRVEEPVENEIARYKIDFDVEGIELDPRVSEKLLTHATNPNDLEQVIGHEHIKKFESYDEVEEYLGVDLLQSSILNNTLQASSLIGGDYNRSDNSKCVSILANAVDEVISAVYIDSEHRIPETDEILNYGTYLLTPKGVEILGGHRIDSIHFDIDDHSQRQVLTESYTSKENSIIAEIVHISETDRYSAYFISDSILYHLQLSHPGQAFDSRGLLIEVIDSFTR